ncbi:hypothetical protein V6C03_00575 [Methyloligella sp. 2.7D]|uniref:hypothetical protein n=1 Tax=unclassified Methyloligella TaxID=2625955 RepID=UPI00157D135C|nr:hypothetical protein [Methyloligella sp. GL2]QKP76834.1 hypothetical protein HT051_04840 [Methyloligella sp. GL2]
MGRSTAISAALHAAILLWILVVLPGSSPLDAPQIREIPVEVLTPSELTEIKAGKLDEESDAPLAAPEQEKPVAVNQPAPPQESAAPPPPPERAEPEPVPEPEPVEQPADDAVPPMPEEKAEAPAPEPAPEPETQVSDQPPPTAPLRRPTPPTEAQNNTPSPTPSPNTDSDFSTDRLAALLNKVPDGGEQASLDAPAENAQDNVYGQSNGDGLYMSANEIDALRARIAQCWNPPPGGLGAGQLIVKLRMKLNEDGTLVGYPTVENSNPSPFFRAAADSAVRAVYQCQPYVLPLEKYSLWRDLILNFDPSDMYRAG